MHNQTPIVPKQTENRHDQVFDRRDFDPAANANNKIKQAWCKVKLEDENMQTKNMKIFLVKAVSDT